MRTILLTLCILGVTLSTQAQMPENEWAEGSYYDLKGNKFSGLISWSMPRKNFLKPEGHHLFFKTSPDAKEVKVKSHDLKCFTMGKDSFVVTHNKDLSLYPILSVVLNSPVKLYRSSTFSAAFGPVAVLGTLGALPSMLSKGKVWSEYHNVYYYGNTPETINKIKRSNYIEIMSQLMADKPDVVAKIKDKTIGYGDIDKLIEYYQTGVMPLIGNPLKTNLGTADDMY